MAGVHGKQEILACKHQWWQRKQNLKGDRNIVDTAVGIMRSKRLNEDQEDTSSKKARKEDGQQSGSLELRMNRHRQKFVLSFVEERYHERVEGAVLCQGVGGGFEGKTTTAIE